MENIDNFSRTCDFFMFCMRNCYSLFVPEKIVHNLRHNDAVTRALLDLLRALSRRQTDKNTEAYICMRKAPSVAERSRGIEFLNI